MSPFHCLIARTSPPAMLIESGPPKASSRMVMRVATVVMQEGDLPGPQWLGSRQPVVGHGVEAGK